MCLQALVTDAHRPGMLSLIWQSGSRQQIYIGAQDRSMAPGLVAPPAATSIHTVLPVQVVQFDPCPSQSGGRVKKVKRIVHAHRVCMGLGMATSGCC